MRCSCGLGVVSLFRRGALIDEEARRYEKNLRLSSEFRASANASAARSENGCSDRSWGVRKFACLREIQTADPCPKSPLEFVPAKRRRRPPIDRRLDLRD